MLFDLIRTSKVTATVRVVLIDHQLNRNPIFSMDTGQQSWSAHQGGGVC